MIFYRIIYSLTLVVLFISCSPKPKINPEKEGIQRSIAYLKSLYKGSPIVIGGDIEIKGFVTSSDRYGNFYKSIFIQDTTGGIEIKLDMKDVFLRFKVGHELRVRCSGLTIGSYGGMLQLGADSEQGYQTSHISVEDITTHIIPTSTTPKEIIPVHLSVSNLSQRYVGCVVAVDNVQFVEADGITTWSESEADTDRYLIDREGNILIVRTSSHAEFAQWKLPLGSGYIEGILTYFNRNYQLKLSDSRNAIMTNPRW